MNTNEPFDLVRDENGNVELKPVAGWSAGWTTSEVPALTSMIIAFDYFDNPHEEAQDKRRTIQLFISAQHALELSAALKRVAERLIASAQPPQSQN